MEIERQQGIKKQFVTLIVSAGECDAPYMSTLWKNGQIVGETTSGAWVYRTNSSIALGMIRSDLASAGTEIEVAFNLSSREYNGKYYHNIDAWKINRSAAAVVDAPMPTESFESTPGSDEDDLPF